MNIEEQFDILYPILNNISPISKKNWDIAKVFFHTKTLKKNEHLFYVEDKVEDFYFLITGLARYYYLTLDGKEFNKSFAEKQGHLLSSISSVSHGTGSPFSVEVLSDYSMIKDVVANYHIASYLGIIDVALSKIRKEMKLT